jgi:hypothetical protein
MNISSLDVDLGDTQPALSEATCAVVGFNIILAVISYFIGKACYSNRRKTNSNRKTGQEETIQLLK